MSDGPYKSLKLPQCWRRVARYAENDSHDSSEVATVVEAALKSEFRKQVGDPLLAAISGFFEDSQSLIPRDCDSQLAGLRNLSSNHQLENLLIASSRRIAREGGTITQAISETLQSWAARHVQSMVEHYLREGDPRGARLLQSRVQEACLSVANEDLALRLVNGATTDGGRNFRRKTGLDEGPSL